MNICDSGHENRNSFRVPCLFSFHHDDEVLKGRNLGLGGFGLEYPALGDGSFHFHRGQVLKNCYIQIEGETIYFSKVGVCWLETEQEGLVYGFKITSIIEPEKVKYKAIYEKTLQNYRNKGVLSLAEKAALDNFFV